MKDQNTKNDNIDWVANIRSWNWTDQDKIHYYTLMRAASFDKTLMFQAEGNKALMYINGGAAVAMLAFCGNYIGQIDWWAIAAILCFSIGAIFSILMFFLAYIAQKNYTKTRDNNGDKYERYLVFITALALLLFISGVMVSANAINDLRQKKQCEMLKK